MKYKLLIFGILFLCLISFTSAYYCYQESANVSNQTGIDGNCGLNYSGTFRVDPLFNTCLIDGLIDGNWNSGMSVFGGVCTYYVTYYTPQLPLMNGSIWISKSDLVDRNAPVIYNITLPSSCFYNSSKISLVLNSNWYAGQEEWYCVNSTAQQLIYFDNGAGGNGWNLFEDAMNWNVTDKGLLSISTNPSSVAFGQSFSLSISSSRLNSSDWVNLSVTFPNGTIGKYNTSTLDNISWVSQNFTALNGTYFINVSSAYNNLSYNFTVVNSPSITPSSFVQTLSVSSSYFINETLDTNTSQYINYSVNCYIDGNFTCVTPSSLLVNGSSYFNATINSSASAVVGTHVGNVTLIRVLDGAVLMVNLSLGVSNNFGVPMISNTSTQSISMLSSDTQTISYNLSNNGTYNLTNCSGSLSNSFLGFTFYSFSNVSSLIPNASVWYNVSFTTPSVGAYSGYLQVACISTVNGSLNSLSVTPLIVLSVSAPTPSSGGGGSTTVVVQQGNQSSMLFAVLTSDGSSSATKLLYLGQSLSQSLVVQSFTATDLSLSASCSGSFCPNVVLSKSSLSVAGRSSDMFSAKLSMPKDVSNDFKSAFDITVSDGSGHSSVVKFVVSASPFAGWFYKFALIVQPNDVGYWFSVNDINVPKLFAYILIFAFIELILYLSLLAVDDADVKTTIFIVGGVLAFVGSSFLF